ncbi:hypothetical protein LZ578_05805 [Jeotgalibaca sp. MA1X17-3]|uniref:hypothetical protein n=1 Tax=Jeotgalibaca sp. MA1X17-3 TaxID=2908211 RepID=UPI001F44B4A1|nr:hypothetical protein [Jeotgalibaca sp. MA1X17-3]UJF16602.1 hypothetical protein LZ578_05805 [Jeotgalibaca sp. MA1X17-3]
MVGIIFYKCLFDTILYHAADLLEEVTNLSEVQEVYTLAYQDLEIKNDLISELKYDSAYILEPELTFTALLDSIYKGKFQFFYRPDTYAVV